MQRGILARRRPTHRLFERGGLPPFLPGTRATIGTDLIDTPIEFEMMAVGIEELDRNLAARAAAAFIDDLRAVCRQMIARPEHLVEGRKLEGKMMQALVVGLILAADEGEAMM